MIRHCSLWKFTDAAPTDLVERLRERFREAADLIPSVRRCETGGDLGYRDTNYDFAITIDFDDLDGYREYVVHDAHMSLFRELLEPYLHTREAVQFPLDAAN